jgi:heterodisulfide reductase subunit A
MNNDVLVIGAGVAGIEASLLLADAGKKVFLIEKSSLIGGKLVKYEEAFPNMECSTCMIAPRQQALLQNPNIELITLAQLESLDGNTGDFTANIKVKAGYVSATDCIGCGACYEPCPISVKNEFEENMSERKAIYVPCPGALPNVPVVDTNACVRFTKKEDCNLCVESCPFAAIDFSQEDKIREIKVGAVIVATGFDMFDVAQIEKLNYGKIGNVFTAMEFERLFASNGPTSGAVVLRDGSIPKKIAIIHCIGRGRVGYCSGVCCMYSAKFVRYIHHKISDAEVRLLHRDICVPGKKYQAFWDESVKGKVSTEYFSKIESIEKNGNGAIIKYANSKGSETFTADMIILAPAIVPNDSARELAKTLGLKIDGFGFIESDENTGVATNCDGVYIAGCVGGPRNVADTVASAYAAVSKIIS